jgi:hypothetical protein
MLCINHSASFCCMVHVMCKQFRRLMYGTHMMCKSFCVALLCSTYVMCGTFCVALLCGTNVMYKQFCVALLCGTHLMCWHFASLGWVVHIRWINCSVSLCCVAHTLCADTFCRFVVWYICDVQTINIASLCNVVNMWYAENFASLCRVVHMW